MLNPIKYLTTSEPLSLNKGNFYFGTGDDGKGPSDSTGYYNGFPPSVGGYIIYLYKDGAPGSLSYHNAPTDNDLISFTNSLSGTSYTTVEECLSYFSSQDNMVVFNKNYESIVTDGLILNLDAGFVSSYPRTGTTWTDLSGSGNTGTLFNGPTYNSDNGGSIVFDGVDDYCDATLNNRSTIANTVEMYVRWRSGSNGMFVGFNIYDIWTSLGNLGFNTGVSDVYGISSSRVTELNLRGTNQNNWHHYVFIFTNQVQNNKIYIDGNEEILSQQRGATNLTSNRVFPTSVRFAGWLSSTGFLLNGDYLYARIYNRELTSEEVLQNYYAGLQRFIPTDGLVLSLDAQNTNTTTNITYDTSGNNNNGTLLNGVQYVSDGNGSWSFDGVDDYISFPQGTFDLTNRSFSLEAIVKWDGNATGTFFSHFSTPVGTQTSIHWRIYTTGTLRFDFYASAIDIPSAISPNTWYHLVITYNYSSDVCTAYINGTMRLSNNAGPYIGSTNLSNTSIGKWMNTEYFGGKVSHFMMYDRILNSEEVTIMYNSVKSTYTI